MQGHSKDINVIKENSTSICGSFYLEDGSSRYLYSVTFYKTVISVTAKKTSDFMCIVLTYLSIIFCCIVKSVYS